MARGWCGLRRFGSENWNRSEIRAIVRDEKWEAEMGDGDRIQVQNKLKMRPRWGVEPEMGGEAWKRAVWCYIQAGVMHRRRASFVECVCLNKLYEDNHTQWGNEGVYISSSQWPLLSSCFAIIVAQCRLLPQRRTLRVNSTQIWLEIALNHMEIHFSCYIGRPGLPFSSELCQRSASALQFV